MRRLSPAVIAILALLLLLAPSASAQNISTVAGGADIYNNVPTLTNNLPAPQYVVVDSAGNFYVSLTSLHRVVKIDSAGMLTFFAGTGTCGSAGDGGPATAAQLCNPMGLALDASGNLFIADFSTQRIRKIDLTTGTITTVVGTGTCGFAGDGGSATLARICSPRTVAFDGSGNLFIADSNNRRVRRVDASTGNITTVAGGGPACNYTPSFPCGDGGPATSASFIDVSGVTVDSAGNLFIVDTNGNRVRKVDAGTGTISTYAGTGSCSFTGSSGPANTIGLCIPFAVTEDSAGNLFIADTGNSRIRKVDTFGNLTTLNFFSIQPNGIFADNAGQLYAAHNNGNRVWKVNVGTGAGTIVAGDGLFSFGGDGGPATSARMNAPTGVALDSSGNIYVTDSNNSRLRKVDTSGTITSLLGLSVSRVRMDNSGNLLVASGCRILRVNPITLASTTLVGTGSCFFSGDGGPATSAALNSPQDAAMDAAGNLYIADTSNYRIRRVDAVTGIITTIAGIGPISCGTSCITGSFTGDGGPASAAGLNTPYAVAVDSGGNVFFADTNNSRVRRVDATTGVINTVVGTGSCAPTDGVPAANSGICFPRGLAFDSSGNLYIADTSNVRVRRVDAQSGIISTVAGGGSLGDGSLATSASVSNPSGIAITPAGDLYVTQLSSGINGRVRRVFVGGGSPGISLSTASIVFPDQPVNVISSALSVTITNTGAAAMLWTGNVVSSSTEFTRTNNCPASIAPGASCTVSITFRPTTFGLRTATLTINDNAPGAPHIVSLSGVGLSAADSASPTTLAFGNQAFNVASAPQVVTVTNTGNSNLNVTSLGLSSSWTQTNNCVGFAIAPGGTCTINVSFRPVNIGALNGVLNISGNALNGTVTITLSGTGVNPSITYSPTSLTFPDQAINVASSPLTFTATNNGSVDFAVQSVSISSGYSQTNDCGTVIAVGASCTVSVSFRPTSASIWNGIVRLNAPVTGVVLPSVNLTGRGIAPVSLFISGSGSYPNNFAMNVQAYGWPQVAPGGPAGDVTITVDGSTQYTTNVAFNAANNTYFQIYSFSIPGLGGGTHTVSATYTPDPQAYYATNTASANISVAKGSQTITFPPLAGITFDLPAPVLAATASSGLPVTYTVIGGPATVSGDVLTITGVGTVFVRASQAGDSNWNAATSVTQSFVVSKGNQTITFDPVPPKTYGDPAFALSASTSSGLTVSFSLVSGPATLAGNIVTITGAGTITVRASQAGNSLWNAATSVDQTINVAKAEQQITYGAALGDKTFGDALFAVHASATSGLAVSFSASGGCTVSGNIVTITGAGSCTITTSQAGNANYNAADDASQTFNIAQAASSTALVSSVNPSLPGQSVTFTATVSSGVGTPTGTVEFFDGATSLGSAPLTAGAAALSTSTLAAAVTHNITAVYSGDANFSGSTSAPVMQTVIDNVPPDVTVPANMTAEATSAAGAAVNFTATASDNLDGPLTPTCTPASGSTFALGTTNVTCSATDAANNTGSAQFSITVHDTTAPVIASHADVNANATSAAGATVTYTPPATSDAVDGAGVATCAPASGSAFPVGNTTVTCNATDAAGNPATSTTFVVRVHDTTPPTVNCAPADGLWHASDVSIACTASDSGSGLANAADANFTLTTSVSAGTENSNAATGTRNVCDNSGNCVTAGPIGGNKVDKKGPGITITAPADNAVYVLNQAATASFTCADGGSGSNTCVGTVANGAAINTSSVGTKSFTVTATDAVGNASTLTYTYKVTYASGGMCNGNPGHAILQPINLDGTSVWKQGSTVPAKFRVCDANGVSVGNAGVVTNFSLYQIQAGTITTVDESPASTTPDTQFRWDSTAQQWIFNISTKQSPVNTANRTYYFRIDLNDGTTILFQFGLK